MARTNATNFTGPLQFPYATAGTDIFKKEDVQTLAQAVDQHDHSTGKGLGLSPTAIADGTLNGSKLVDGTVTSAKIQDGTITGTDIANASVTNAKLASDVGRANLLTNGGFELWQRGNGPFTAATLTADRWQSQMAGTDTYSLSKDTTNMDGSGACAAVTFTLGTGGGVSSIYQVLIESLPQLIGRLASVSIRVRTTTANAVRVALSDQSGANLAVSPYHSGNGAYQTLTCSLSSALPTAATGLYLKIYFAASCTAYLDNAMLVVGSQPCDYVPLHPADDLARCLRYYEIIGGNGEIGFSGYGGGGAPAGQYIRYRAAKAVYPTYTKNGTWTVSNCGQPSFAYVGTGGMSFQVAITATGNFNVGDTGSVGNNFVIEANP